MSDSDLDAELLGLADESSQEEDNVPRSPPKRETSDLKKSGEKSPPRRGVAQKLKSRGRARRARRDDSEEEDAFGESDDESPPPVARLPSGSGDELEDEAPLYPIEGKFRSEADRSDIMAMTEIEREEILAERAAEAQRRAQDQQLKRLLQARRGADDGKKRKADADLEDGARKSSRQKTTATSKIEEYKRQRELKGAARARGEEGRRKERSPSAGGSYSDRDADGESDEVEWDDGRRASPPARKDEPPPDLRDFERCRVGRSQFAKYCFYPTFDTLIKHCYVRVNVGMESSGPRYRMCQIKRFNEGRPYVVDGPNGKKIYTNQYILASNGQNEKEYPFAACSDSRFTESDFDEYTATLKTDGVRLPTRSQLAAKCDDERAMIEHRFTDADIQTKIEKARDMRKAFDDANRDRLVRRRDEAAARGDDATVARCTRELASFDSGAAPPAKNSGAAAANGTPKKVDQQARLAELNKANRKANSEEIRKALVAEKMAQQRARAAAAARIKEEEERKAAAEEAAKANGGLKVPGDDLFGEGSDVSQAGTPRKGRSRAGTPMNGLKEKKSLGQFSKKKTEDEVIAGMDLGIDIDI